MRFTHHVLVSLSVKAMSENCYDENVDDERDNKGNSRLDEEIHVCFFYFRWFFPVDTPGLKKKIDKKIKIKL